MITPAGMIWGPRKASYVYAVVQGESIYFGETGDLPARRWGQHLGVGGTFTSALGIEGFATSDEVLFVGVRCTAVDGEMEAYRKLARRAVEEELHRQFFLDSGAFGEELSVVSNAPSAPVRVAWSFDPRAAAIEAYRIVVNDFKRWRAAYP